MVYVFKTSVKNKKQIKKVVKGLNKISEIKEILQNALFDISE